MKKNVKRGFYLVLTLLIILLNIVSVFAYSHYGGFFSGFSGGVGGFLEQTGSYIDQILAPFIGPSETPEFSFAKILLFFLLFSIIFMVMKKIDIFAENTAVSTIVSLIVSIFAVRFIKENEFITGILLPYGALGIAIATFLPLLIYFYFIHFSGIGPFGRRTAWFIYGVIFLVLWGSRPYAELGDANWIYILGIGFILINLLFDRGIHDYLGLAGLARWRERAEDARIANLQAEYQDIIDIDSPHAKRRRIAIERELRRHKARPI